MQYRNYFTNKNEWTFSPNTSIGEVSQYFINMKTFQFKGNFITNKFIKELKKAESISSTLEEKFDAISSIFIKNMLPVNKWIYSKNKNYENKAVFAINVGIIPFKNSKGVKGKNLSYTFQIFRNQSIVDLVKHGHWLTNETSGFEEFNYLVSKTKDLLLFRDLQSGLAKKISDIFVDIRPFIIELNNEEKILRKIEKEKAPIFLAINLPIEYSNWLKSGAAQLDRTNNFNIIPYINEDFPRISKSKLINLKKHADLVKNTFIKRGENKKNNINYDIIFNGRKKENRTNVSLKYKIISPQKVITNAFNLIGYPFLWNGNNKKGFGIAGFILYLRYISGLTNIGNKTYIQANQLRKKNRLIKPFTKAIPSDLLFWGPKGAEFQVGVYVGGGQYIGIKGPKTKVSLWPLKEQPDVYDALF